MASYPKLPRFTVNELVDLQRMLLSWSNELTRELDTRDIQAQDTPSTTINTVVSTSEIGRPANGNVAYSISASKFRGYVDGTGWVDFN
tara:strand:- start:660 stop:923 length:264 start_codon:yes stop_codon:yes gene_type:complete